jgi:4-amino-4-deoxy-L-arabinose transferase-like glycosyltransferase
MRFWQITDRPGFEWDETVYTGIAENLNHTGIMSAKMQQGVPLTPYMFHPPYYFRLLAWWFSITAEGIGSARIWAALMSLVVLIILYLLLRLYLPWKWAVGSLAVVATDGWLVYENRLSYIENTVMVLVAAGMYVYAKSSAHTLSGRSKLIGYMAAGLLLGSAIAFKYIAAYVLLAVVINWLICWRDHRYHLALFGSIGLMGLVALAMIAPQSRASYIEAILIQLRRTDGSIASNGNVASLSDAIQPLMQQYWVFAPTVVVCALGGLCMILRVVQAVKRRTWSGLRQHSVLLAWAAAGILALSASKLRFPHYFIIVLVPLLCFTAVEMSKYLRREPNLFSKILTGGVIVVCLAANAGTYQARIAAHQDNALGSAAAYISENIPKDDLVIADETIGAAITQPWCSVLRTYECVSQGKWLVTYESQTQRLPDDPALRETLTRSTAVGQFKGFKEDITVRRIDDPSAAKLVVPEEDGNVLSATLTDDWALVRLPSVAADQTSLSVTLRLIQGPGGNHQVAWQHWIVDDNHPEGYASNVIWPDGLSPELATEAGQENVYTFTTFDGGLNWLASIVK